MGKNKEAASCQLKLQRLVKALQKDAAFRYSPPIITGARVKFVQLSLKHTLEGS